jgi:hypothetical protein
LFNLKGIFQRKQKKLFLNLYRSGRRKQRIRHVITNAHVVQNCKKVTIGDNANKQVPAELINTDRSNDLALLKLSSLEMAHFLFV